MTKKTRFVILLICILTFFISAPYLILSSLGYRVDFKNLKIVATGGIYVVANPGDANIFVDSKPGQTTSFFSTSVFVQNLMPGPHQVSIKKTGYYDYQKTLPVQENEVTKLEHVMLIKKFLTFQKLQTGVAYFSFSPDGNKVFLAGEEGLRILNLQNNKLQKIAFSKIAKTWLAQWSTDSQKILLKADASYFLLEPFLTTPETSYMTSLAGASRAFFNPQDSSEILYIKNKKLYVESQTAQLSYLIPTIKNLIDLKFDGQNIVWLDPDGIVYVSTIIRNQNQTAAITKTVAKNEKKPLKIEKGKNYEVVAQGNFNSVLVKENNNLFLLDSKIDGFENYGQSQTFSVSPDGQNLLYCGPSETMISLANPSSDPKRVSLNEKAGIKDCFWINNDYIIFGLTDAVAISEIDIRGNVNIVQFSQKNQNLFFNQQDKKLYILSDRNLLVSEKLIQ